MMYPEPESIFDEVGEQPDKIYDKLSIVSTTPADWRHQVTDQPSSGSRKSKAKVG
jgi:hypothetical protein